MQPDSEPQHDERLINVKDAAARLDLTPWSVYKLLDEGKIDGRYQGRRRYVRVASLNEYVKNLPTTAPDTAA